MTSARRPLRALAFAAVLASLVGVFAPLDSSATTAPASAQDSRSFLTASAPASLLTAQGAGSSFCGSVSGTVNGATVHAYNLGPSFDNVYACGPTEDQWWSNDPFEPDFQCVELSTRFMWDAYGLRAAPGNGGVFVADNHAKFPFIAVGTPAVGSLPAPGDVVSLSGGPNADPSGHTAVVSDVSHVNKSTGNGYITVVEENDGGAGTGRINVSNWSESMGSPTYANGLYWYTNVSWLELAGYSGPSETRVCSTCTPPLLNHGGPVMAVAAVPTPNRVRSLYWTGSSPFSANYANILDGYLANVAASDPAGNVFGSNPQYGSTIPTTGPFVFAGRLTDASALPQSGCSADPGYTTCLNDFQVQGEINQIISTQASSAPLDLAHLFVLFLPPGVESCTVGTLCSANSYCGYHSSYAQAGGTVLYAVVPYPTAGACTTGQSPNGDPIADGAVDALSHQLNEALTDPLGNGWTDGAGNEIGDECANVYGPPLGSADGTAPLTTEYNQQIGSGRYYTQEEFSNAAYSATGHGCVQSPNQAAGPPANTVAVAASLTQITSDGTSTSAVTASVKSAEQQPVAGERLHFATFSQSGTCGTVTPTDVTATSTGQASTTYVASSSQASCTVIAVESATGQNGIDPLNPFAGCNGTPLAGDFTGSGRANLLSVGSNGTCVLSSNGTSFTSLLPWSKAPFFGNKATLSAAVTGDHRSDLVAISNDSTWVLPSTGSAFGAPQKWSKTPFYGTRATLAVDVNGDGIADLVAVDDTATWVMLSTGSGFSAPQKWSSGAFYGTRATIAADVNGDGRVDLVAVDDTATWVMLNTGTWFATAQRWSGTPFYGSRRTLAGDVTGDGRADLVAVDDTGVWVMHSNGSGFTSPTLWRSGGLYGTVATLGADMNGDGKMDLVVINNPGTWVSTSSGSAFSALTEWWTGYP